MGFDSFARMAGFDSYFGLNEYPDKNDFDGIWESGMSHFSIFSHKSSMASGSRFSLQYSQYHHIIHSRFLKIYR